jgi:hypothetical protein
MPLRVVLAWRHAHEFAAITASSTQVTDHLTTSVPACVLRPVFAYRHRQLADDLTAHQQARRLHNGPGTVAVTGSSGLVGSALIALLTRVTPTRKLAELAAEAPARTPMPKGSSSPPAPKSLIGC